jgi:uncharacterized glyoxalase superfamily protein PhnB
MKIQKVTAVMVVQDVQPCIEFWSARLGFEVTTTVPEGDEVGFAILARDGVEIMYQSVASVAKDNPSILQGQAKLRTVLFFEVDDLDEVERKLAGVPPLFERRKTFYGSEEICVPDPAGNVVTFAKFSAR